MLPLKDNTAAARKERLPLATLDRDPIPKIRKKKRLKLMNFQHRILGQSMVAPNAD